MRAADAFDAVDADHMDTLRRSAEETLRSRFASVRMYDAAQRLTLEVVDVERGVTCPDPGSYVHELRPGEMTHYHRIGRAGLRSYMQVLLPIKNRDSALLGYFEGVYEVDAETARATVHLMA